MSNAYRATQVSTSRSQEQIRKILREFGARGAQFSEDFEEGKINIRFAKEINGFVRTISVSMQIPEPPQPKKKRKRSFRLYRGRMVYDKTPEEKKEQMARATYRAFHDWLKAQFVAVEFGLRSFEDAFIADFEITMKGGKVTTIGNIIKPQLAETRPEFLLGEVVEM